MIAVGPVRQPRPARRPGRSRDEAGQLTALIVGLAVCLLLVVVAVTDVSAAYLRRQSALSLSDSAALAATRAAAVGSIYHSGAHEFVPIEQHQALLAVQAFLRSTGAYTHYPGLRAQVHVVGTRVIVHLEMPYRLPISVPGVAAVTQIHATSAAELPIYS